MVARINGQESRQVAALRREGKTDRQIESIVGLTYGLLSKPFIVDAYDDRALEAHAKDMAEWEKRWARPFAWHKPKVYGWVPNGDCVGSRPNESPRRGIRPSVSRHAYDD